MLEFTPREGSNAATLVYRGRVTDEDYRAVTPAFERFMEAHETARLLVDLAPFEGVGPEAVLDDLQLTTRYLDRFERVAVLADERWQTRMTELSKAFTAAEVRTFAPAERAQAERWLLA